MASFEQFLKEQSSPKPQVGTPFAASREVAVPEPESVFEQQYGLKLPEQKTYNVLGVTMREADLRALDRGDAFINRMAKHEAPPRGFLRWTTFCRNRMTA